MSNILYQKLLNIKILYNPHAIICNTDDRKLCKIASDFFNIPIIVNPDKEERIIIIGIPTNLKHRFLYLDTKFMEIQN